MIAKIEKIADVETELMRYFAVLQRIPKPKKPVWAKNHLWQLIVSEPNSEDADEACNRLTVTGVDVADFWYMTENYMVALEPFEYKLLMWRYRPKPLPWKVIEYRTRFTRQWLKVCKDKALERLFVQMKS